MESTLNIKICNIKDYVEYYIKNLYLIPNIKNKINYEIGIPMKYLTRKAINNKKKLLELCKEYNKTPSELEKDIDDETNEYLNLKEF